MMKMAQVMLAGRALSCLPGWARDSPQWVHVALNQDRIAAAHVGPAHPGRRGAIALIGAAMLKRQPPDLRPQERLGGSG
jgi:hypothetical protein